MSIIPIEYTSISTSSNTLFCNDVDTFLDNSISNVSTIVINEGCVNVYFPIMYFNGLIYVNSNSTTNVNLYLPVIDIPSSPPYKYDTPVLLLVGKYRYIQYSFNKLPFVIEIITPSPPNIFPVNTDPKFYMFDIEISGTTAVITDPFVSNIFELFNAGSAPAEGYIVLGFKSPIKIFPQTGATHRMLFYSFDICTNGIISTSTNQDLTYYRIPGTSFGNTPGSTNAGRISILFPETKYKNPGTPPTESTPVTYKVDPYSSIELGLIFPIRCFIAIQPLATP
jgi:hypothetical protein